MICFLAFTKVKFIVLFPSRSRFPAKLICCIAFGDDHLLFVVYLNLLKLTFEMEIIQ